MAYASPVFSFICARCAVVTRLSSSFFFFLLVFIFIFFLFIACWRVQLFFRVPSSAGTCFGAWQRCGRVLFVLFFSIFFFFTFSLRVLLSGVCFLFSFSWVPPFVCHILVSAFPVDSLFIYLFLFFSRPRFDICRRRVHPSRAAICWPLGALAGGCRVSRLYVFFSFCSIISSTFSSFLFCLASSSRFRLLFFFLVFFFCVAVSFVLSS